MRSFSSPDMPPRKACAPTRENWMTAAPPPRMAKSPTLTWPASITLLERMTLLPTLQSCPTWLLARKAQRSPMTVAMPPPSVPGFMVTPSRMMQSLPTASVDGSPLYLRSCGWWPMEANGKTRVRAPMVVRPTTTAWLSSTTPSLSTTSAPTWQKGPIRTSSPSRAPASTIAVAWTSHLGIIRIQDHGADLGLGHHLTVHFRLAVEAPRTSAAAQLLHMIVQLVARQHRLAELGAVYPHEIHELGFVGDVEVADAQGARRLSQPLDDQNARHDRELGEVPLEERLVDGDALDADGADVGVHLDDLVDQQERIAMRQQLHHARDVGRAELFGGRSLTHSLARSSLISAPLPYQPSLLAAGALFPLR